MAGKCIYPSTYSTASLTLPPPPNIPTIRGTATVVLMFTFFSSLLTIVARNADHARQIGA